MTETRSPDRGAQPFEHSYEDWWDQLEGKPSSIPASRVGLGFYARRERNGSHTGVAIWLADGHPVAKVGQAPIQVFDTKAKEEDFSFHVLSWCAAVPQEAYVAWAANGAWPEGVNLDRPKPNRPKPEPRRKASEAVAAVEIAPEPAPTPIAVEQQPDLGGLIVRAYAAIDPPSAGMAFLARAIARRGKGEGFSVCFHGETAEAAVAKAHAWIAAERKRQEPAPRRAPRPAESPSATA